MSDPGEISASVEPADGEAGRALLAAMTAELDELYRERPGTLDSLPVTPQDFDPPAGAFVVLRDGAGSALACGGVKRADDETGEIKRMYVVPAARGSGIARRLLTELEAQALRLGYTRARLDTGPDQPAAKALYERSGYVAVEPFNDNPYAAHWFVKRLAER